jgi:hypothetical protein
MFGSDIPFMAWLRSQEKELPSYSANVGFAATDVDLFIHRYLTGLQDAEGTRDIQALMMVEVKTRGGSLRDSQRDTLAKIHACCGFREVEYCGQALRHFGVSVLFLSGTTPDDSDEIIWGRFDPKKAHKQHIKCRSITRERLFELLRFDRHPDNLSKNAFRRHHLTREIEQVVKAPLGFEYLRKVKKRS